MIEGLSVGMVINALRVPLFDEALEYADMGLIPGGAYRNESSAGICPHGRDLSDSRLSSCSTLRPRAGSSSRFSPIRPSSSWRIFTRTG